MPRGRVCSDVFLFLMTGVRERIPRALRSSARTPPDFDSPATNAPMDVVEGLDGVGHCASGRAAHLRRKLVKQLRLERYEETLGDRVVPEIFAATRTVREPGPVQSVPAGDGSTTPNPLTMNDAEGSGSIRFEFPPRDAPTKRRVRSDR